MREYIGLMRRDGEEPNNRRATMTQISSIGAKQFGETASSGFAAAASGLFSKIRKPDVLVVLAICAAGLVLTLIAAFSMPEFSESLTEINLVGP
jgi:hypothetical protein